MTVTAFFLRSSRKILLDILPDVIEEAGETMPIWWHDELWIMAISRGTA
jgi:hypothetical protein